VTWVGIILNLTAGITAYFVAPHVFTG
jgi:hypothetical protein